MASVDAARAGEDELLTPELRKRLEVHRIDLPPLRRRREDVPGFVRLVIAERCARQRAPLKAMSSQAMSLLAALPWRGNLTELGELLETLVANVPGRTIRVPDVLTHVCFDAGDVTCSKGGTLKEARERFERDYVAAVLVQHQGRMAQAARALGMQRANLYRKVRQLAVARQPVFPRRPGASTRVDRHDPKALAEGALPGTPRSARLISKQDAMEVR
jgi:two-component system nitrogen regulation response regulator NtrX